MRIDSHQHFWHYTEADFGWIEFAAAAVKGICQKLMTKAQSQVRAF